MEVIALGSEFVHWYLVRTNDGVILIDTGFHGYLSQFEQAMCDHQIAPEQLKAVLLTHAHTDHIGFAETIRKQFHIPVFIHKDDQLAASKIDYLPPKWFLLNCWRPSVIRSMFHALLVGKTFGTKAIQEVIPFTDGEVLPVPGKPLVIHTPGHTLGESCFYFEQEQILFCGDALVTHNILTGKHGEPQLLDKRINKNQGMAYGSLTKIARLGEITLYPGHGESWKGNASQLLKKEGFTNKTLA